MTWDTGFLKGAKSELYKSHFESFSWKTASKWNLHFCIYKVVIWTREREKKILLHELHRHQSSQKHQLYTCTNTNTVVYIPLTLEQLYDWNTQSWSHSLSKKLFFFLNALYTNCIICKIQTLQETWYFTTEMVLWNNLRKTATLHLFPLLHRSAGIQRC